MRLEAMAARARVYLLFSVGWALCESGALAQERAEGGSEADGKDAAESRATSFQAVEGPTKEEVPGGALLVSAYAFVLVLLVAYVARLASLQNKTQREVERVARALIREKLE